MSCESCVIKPPKEPPVEKVFKRVRVAPGRYGVVTIPHNFIPDGDMNPDTGEWDGWVEEK